MVGIFKQFARRRRRERLRATPFPESWLRILEAGVPLFKRLSSSDREELKWRIQVFLSEKQFEGCGGLTMTDEIRVTIAAYGCLLLLHRDTDFFPRLYSILVYPTAYVVPVEEEDEDALGIVHEGSDVLCGEAWPTGAMVLSWEDVCQAASDDRDGTNVALHEFAHLLDMESGESDGTPILSDRDQYVTWAQVFGKEYEKLRRAGKRGEYTVLDEYGAEHPAEFFSVATECFFENPVEMKHKHPALYRELKRYYQQDPARFFSTNIKEAGD